MSEIRGLSVRPPWSWAITWAGKDIENRTWGTTYRGLVAVHASLKIERDALMATPAAIRKYLTAQRDMDPRLAVTGAIVAVAELADCHDGAREQGECSDWALRWQWHWRLVNVRPLRTPVPCKGSLGLWRLPPDVEAAVRAQMESAT